MPSTAGWRSLDRAIGGDVLLPGSREFDIRHPALNARFDDVRPQAVVRCRSSEDVVETIRFAHGAGMEVATRNGGHCFGGRSSTKGLLVDVTPLRSVEISAGTVTVGGGTRLGEVYGALLEQDLAVPGGSCPSVGIAGLSLGGGLGIIGRKHGLTSDHLVSAQIVVADGRALECEEHREDDLFWALRGAGAGNFGVVTSLTFRTIAAPAATNFHLAWPFSKAAAMIDAWQSWAPTAPDELAASLLIGASAEPEDPPSVGVFGVMLGTEPDTAELVDELVTRTGSDPESAFRKHMSFRETTRYWGERAARERVEWEPPGWGATRSPLHQVGVLPAAFLSGGDRRVARELPEGPSSWADSRAGFLAVGRRLQPHERRCHRLRSSRRPLLAEARHRGQTQRVRG